MREVIVHRHREDEIMVYCSKCGTLNSDSANNCINCGALLKAGSASNHGPDWRYRRYEGGYYRRGSGIGALIFGAIVIVLGLSFLLSEVYGLSIPWWPIILILIGLWVLISGFRRSRRYSSYQTGTQQQ